MSENNSVFHNYGPKQAIIPSMTYVRRVNAMEGMGRLHFGAPDGSGKPARLRLYRGIYALTWSSATGSRRVSLGTRDAGQAIEVATALYGRFGRDEPVHTPTIQHWLTKRLQAARERARKTGVACTLTPDGMRAMYEHSGGRCEVSGIPFDLTRGKNGWKQPWRMSLDRKVPALGYTPENCRLVCNAVNAAMGAWGADVLVTIARAIVARQG